MEGALLSLFKRLHRSMMGGGKTAAAFRRRIPNRLGGIGFRGRIMGKYLFWGAFFFAYLINGITGFAGNVFAMPVGIQTIGHDTSIVVLNCTGLLASCLIAFTGIKHVVWREVAKMSVIMLVFMAVGAWLNTVVPLPILTKIYGVAVLVMAFRGLLAGGEDKLLPEWALLLILSIAGLIQGMFVSGGSFLAIYALQKLRDKDAFRSTTTMTWVILNGVYSLYGIQAGGFEGDGLLIVAVCIPLLIVATWLGGAIQKRVSQEQFVKASYVLLLVVGVFLLFK